MKKLYTLLIAVACAVSVPAWGQGSERKVPADPGMRVPPNIPKKTPSEPGMVVVPPRTGSEADTVVTPPKNIDPGITEPTDDIDRKNREKSKEMKKE